MAGLVGIKWATAEYIAMAEVFGLRFLDDENVVS